MKKKNYPALCKIELELTYRCPRQCVYCSQKGLLKALYGNASNAQRKELKTREIYSLLKQAAEMGVEWVNLGGGEPCLRRDILELIEYASGLGLKTGLPTKKNFSPDQMRALKSAGLTVIGISLDSHLPGIANKLTGDKDYFDQAVNNIKLAKKAGIQVMLLPVITKLTIDGFPDLLKFARKLGVDVVRPQIYQSEPLMVKPYRRGKFGKKAQSLYLDKIEALKKINSMNSPLLEQRAAPSEGTTRSYPRNCSIGKGIISIRPDGKAYLCSLISDFVVGDIRKDSLSDIWHCGIIKDILFPREELFSGTACYSCKFFHECNAAGRCVYECFQEHGRPFAPESNLCRQLNKHE